MATFPSLEPTTRAFSLGDIPQLTHEASSGVDVRFAQGSDRVFQNLSLGYEYLSETEAKQISQPHNIVDGQIFTQFG